MLKFVIKIHWFISLRIIESLQNNFLSIVFLLKKKHQKSAKESKYKINMRNIVTKTILVHFDSTQNKNVKGKGSLLERINP